MLYRKDGYEIFLVHCGCFCCLEGRQGRSCTLLGQLSTSMSQAEIWQSAKERWQDFSPGLLLVTPPSGDGATRSSLFLSSPVLSIRAMAASGSTLEKSDSMPYPLSPNASAGSLTQVKESFGDSAGGCGTNGATQALQVLQALRS